MSHKIVAAVQFVPKPLGIEENLAAAQSFVFEAARKGARVIALTELCLCGSDSVTRENVASLCQPADGYQTNAFVPICERFNCHVVFGYVEACCGKLFNSAAIVGPRGLEGNARKHNLSGTDYLWSDTGDGMWPIVVTSVGRLGTLLSKDSVNLYRKSYMHGTMSNVKFYEPNSVDIIALLARSTDVSLPNDDWMQLAESLDANVIVSNNTGPSLGGSLHSGGSCVISRDMRVWTNKCNFVDATIAAGLVEV
jgi:predicted amidohydrolase